MLHLSLPIRPRVNVGCEYLITPISLLQQQDTRILCLSHLKSQESVDYATEYLSVLSAKIGKFDRVVKDSELNFLSFAREIILSTLRPQKQIAVVKHCQCRSYEELKDARMFDLRRVVNNHCVFCNSQLREDAEEVLLSDLFWTAAEEYSCNHSWVSAELKHFLTRQTITHKISKLNEVFRLNVDESEFGVRYQVLWASLIVYLSKTGNDLDVTLHFVNKVQDKAFLVSSLAKMMNPAINLHLKRFPSCG